MGWAIGASQAGKWAIGASMPDAGAAPAGGGPQIISIITSKILVPFMWFKQGKATRRQFIRNTIASILGT